MSESAIPNGPDIRQAASQEYPELRPATYDFPPGTPAQVPADFGQAREQQLAGQLTPDEIAEFRELQREKKARDKAAADAAAEAAARLSPPTHHVRLADGQTVDGSAIATHWASEDDELIPVIGAYPMAEFVTLL